MGFHFILKLYKIPHTLLLNYDNQYNTKPYKKQPDPIKELGGGPEEDLRHAGGIASPSVARERLGIPP